MDTLFSIRLEVVPLLVKRISIIFTLVVGLLLNACASVPGEPSEQDPWEGFNRSIYSFNEGVDRFFLKPIAETYRDITPDIIQTGVSNFFSNLGDLLVIINDLLQLKFEQTAQDIARFLLNSTIGFVGVFDVATPLGLPKHDEDFGQTLGYWGVGSGPYLVLPLLGPSSLRDAGGLVVDYSINPVRNVDDSDDQLALDIASIINTRTRLLRAEEILDTAILGDDDRYSFFRDAWLSRRNNQVYDGNPPDEGDDLDALDELDELDALDQ